MCCIFILKMNNFLFLKWVFSGIFFQGQKFNGFYKLWTLSRPFLPLHRCPSPQRDFRKSLGFSLQRLQKKTDRFFTGKSFHDIRKVLQFIKDMKKTAQKQRHFLVDPAGILHLKSLAGFEETSEEGLADALLNHGHLGNKGRDSRKTVGFYLELHMVHFWASFEMQFLESWWWWGDLMIEFKSKIRRKSLENTLQGTNISPKNENGILSRWFSELPVWWDMYPFPGGYPEIWVSMPHSVSYHLPTSPYRMRQRKPDPAVGNKEMDAVPF